MAAESRWLFLTVGAGSIEFEQAAERLISQASNFPNFDAFICLKTQALIQLVPDLHLDSASGTRGFGYYRWKSRVVHLALSGFWGSFDGLCFVDAGCDMNFNVFTNHKLQKNIEYAEAHGVLAYTISTPERMVTKRKVLEFFNAEEDYSDQFQSGTFFLHGDLGRSIASEWDSVCTKDVSFSDDSLTTGGEYSDFFEHRHDQSIFSLVLKKNCVDAYLPHPPGLPPKLNLSLENLFAPVWWTRNRSGQSSLRNIERTLFTASRLHIRFAKFFRITSLLFLAKYVYVRLGGGLGNQLHQYTAGRAVSENCGKTLLIDVGGISNSDHGSSSNAADFRLSGVTLNSKTISLVFRIKRKIYGRLLQRYEVRSFFIAPDSGYSPELLQRSSQISYLEGFFHTYMYSKEISHSDLRLELALINQSNDWFQCKVAEMKDKKICAVHIRRGDYEQTWQHYGVLSEAYYESAMAKINVGDVDEFWIFSDEQNLDLSSWLFFDRAKVKVISPPSGASAAESLVLMSRANWIIMANSTYSWWAGFLASPDEKIVVCPQPFFRTNQEIAKLYPDKWEKVAAQWRDYGLLL